MNSEIEQRIVAMYFDNKDFEKNAKQTIDTLGELKSNLNLENSVKGFDELDKAGKKLNLNQARTTVRNMKDALSGMEGTLKKAFDIGTAPIHALDNFFGTFRSYVGKFVGFDLASKFVGSLESAMRQLTVAPIEAGWSMYQANVDSTKTIMSGTLKSYKEQMSKTSADWTYDEEKHMEFVKGQLAELSRYAQQTVFSLSDMTANVGKFTNNNIDLETSVSAMEGIANMTAKAGQGAQQASMAMYNFSQALGVGKMTTIDWKSIENANLATTELKQLFIDTAEAAGKLTKEVTKTADGKELEKFFITVDKNGKKLAKNKWVEISAENFRDSLSNGWLDKETMLRVFQLYSNQVKDIDTLAAWGFDTSNEELVNYLFGIGEEAEKAATQVRTFQKMWDAMTESVQSGWADTMQFVFGDMLEATEFWSTINDKIGAVLDSSAKKRNDILREWRGMSYDEETGEWKKIEGAVDGREDLIQAIYGTIDALKDIGAAFKQAWADVFGGMTGKRLQEITKGFRDLVDRFREWLGTTEDEGSRISKLSRALRGIFNIVKIVVNVIKAGFGVVRKLVAPVADIFINLFDKVFGFFDGFADLDFGAAVEKLKDGVIAAWEAIKGFFRPSELIAEDGTITYGESPFTAAVNNFFTGIADTIHGWMNDLGLEELWGHLTNAWDWIKDIWNKITSWSGWTAIATFFVDTWTAIKRFFSPSVSEGEDGEQNVEDSPFIKWLTSIWDGIKSVWNSIAEWKGWAAIGTFGTSVWSAIVNFFAPKEVKDAKGKTIGHTDSQFVSWIRGTWDKIKGVWNSVTTWPGWQTIGNFFGNIWDWICDTFDVAVNWFSQPVKDGKTGFVLFLEAFKAKAQEIWDSIVTWPGWQAIGTFFGNIWDWIKEKAGVAIKWFTEPVDEGKTGFVLFIEKFWENIQSIWFKVVNWPGWQTIGNFFGNIWDWIKEKAGVAIKWFSEPVQDGKTGFILFLEKFWGNVQEIWHRISGWEGWSKIGEFFGNIWNKVLGFFKGNEDSSEVTKATDGFTEGMESVEEAAGAAAPVTKDSVSLLERIINAISGFIQNVVDKIDGLVIPPEVSEFFKNMGDFFTGLMKFVGDILGKIGRTLSGSTNIADMWPLIVGGALYVVTQIVGFLNAKHLSGVQVESAATKFMAIGAGILMISSAIALLTTVDTGKMLAAAGVVTVIGIVIAKVLTNLTGTTNSLSELAANKAMPVTPTERIINNLIDGIEKVGMIAVALALLPNIIKAFGEAKKMAPELSGKDILETLLGLTAMISGVSIVLGLLSKMTRNQGLDPVAAIKTALAIAGFFGALVTGFGLIGGVIGISMAASDELQGAENGATAKSVQKSLNDVSEVIKSLMGIVRGFWDGLVGNQTDEERIKSAQDILLEMAQNLEVFTAEKSSGLLRVLNLIGTLTQLVKDVPDAGKISVFSKQIGPLVDALAQFSHLMDGFTSNPLEAGFIVWNPNNLEGQVKKIESVFEVFNKLGHSGLSGYTAQNFINGIRYLNENMNQSDFDAFGKLVAGMVQAFENAIQADSGPMADMAGALMENLSKAIRIGLRSGTELVGAFDATPIVDSIVVALGYGETAIAAAVHAMVQAGLDKSQNPGDGNGGYTFDLNNLEGIMGFLNNPDELENAFDTKGLTNWLYGEGGTAENPAKDSLVGALGGFQTYMDGYEIPDISGKLASAFSFKDPETGKDMDLTSKLTEALNSVQEKINETSFEIKIVPIIDMSHLDAEVIRKTLGDYPVRMPMGNFNMPESIRMEIANLAGNINLEGVRSDIKGVTTAVDLNRDLTVKAINAMKAEISGLNSAISKIKLYLDTGLLVGGITPMIDRELGRRASAASVTGVSPIFGANYRPINIDMEQ